MRRPTRSAHSDSNNPDRIEFGLDPCPGVAESCGLAPEQAAFEWSKPPIGSKEV